MAYKQNNNPFKKNSPNKFLKGLRKVALGGLGNLLGGKKLFGKNKPPSGPTLNPNTMTWNQPTNMNTGSSVFGNSPMSPTTVATQQQVENLGGSTFPKKKTKKRK